MSEQVVWKFELRPWSIFLDLPQGAQLLRVGVQENVSYVWALCRADAPKVSRMIFAHPTGLALPHDAHDPVYVGSFDIDEGTSPLVFHVFDGGERPSPARWWFRVLRRNWKAVYPRGVVVIPVPHYEPESERSADCWPPMMDRVVRALREAREGRYGKNEGWLNALQIRNVILNTENGSSPPIELLTSVWPVRRALRILPHEILETRIVRRLTQYRLVEAAPVHREEGKG